MAKTTTPPTSSCSRCASKANNSEYWINKDPNSKYFNTWMIGDKSTGIDARGVPGQRGQNGEGILAVDSIEDLRNLSPEDISDLESGLYKSVQVNGYYEPDDTPSPIHYYISENDDPDDGGSIIQSGDVKMEHDFGEIINPLYYGAQTGLTQDLIDRLPSDTTYEITSIIDLGGQTITPPLRSTFLFAGGKFINGGISATRDYKISGDYKNGLSSLVDINYALPLEDTSLLLDVTDLPASLKKYNMTGDNTSDCSDNFTGIFNDPWFQRMSKRRPVTILFPSTNRSAARQTFLFKKPVYISTTQIIDLTILLYSDIRFDLSGYSFRSITDIENGETQARNLNCFNFVNFNTVRIYGIGRLNNSQPNNSNRIVIDGGFNTINGNYYEGITVNGVFYYGTDRHAVIESMFTRECIIKGVYVKNACSGIIASGNYVHIDNCEASDIIGDNGITVPNSQNENLLMYNRFAEINNCYTHECQDLGISIGVPNAVVSNCVSENNGNNNISNLETYGINNSFNAGGGYSTELLSVKNASDRINVNVTYINCVAKNCYNYGFFGDSGGIRYISCKVINITPTYRDDVNNSEQRYSTNQIRAGAAFVHGGAFTPTKEPIVVSDCHIENVSFIFKTNPSGSAIISNSIIKQVVGNSVYNLDDIIGAKILDCQLDSNHQFNINYFYRNNFTRDGQNIPLKSFTTVNRPNLALFTIGEYGGLDTTLNKPIYKGSATTWVDATGATV